MLDEKILKQGSLAISALCEYFEKEKTGSISLFPEIDYVLNLVVTYKRMAQTKAERDFRYIEFPHSFYSLSDRNVCLIVKDLSRTVQSRTNPDVEEESREWRQILAKEHNITNQNVTKIITKREMERVYRTFEQKKNLASSYDIFVVDAAIHKSVIEYLGKVFYKAHKVPFVVHLKNPLLPQIERKFHLTSMCTRSHRDNGTIKIGHLAQSKTELIGNLTVILKELFLHCRGGLANIRSLSLVTKVTDIVAPIYADLEWIDHIIDDEAKPKMREEEIRDELSTLPEGMSVGVKANGKVIVYEGEKANFSYPTRSDEWEENDDIQPKRVKVKRKSLKKKGDDCSRRMKSE